MLVIIDYGMGNLFSIQQACEKVGIEAVISSDPETIWQASAIILPGVGAFPKAMEELRKRGLIETIKAYAQDKTRLVIGICLGMQLMMERSEENGGAEGFGWFKGDCLKIIGLRSPRVGWHLVRRGWLEAWNNSPLDGLQHAPFYFSHSYEAQPYIGEDKPPQAVTDQAMCAMIGNGSNIWGLQFHPEKSGPAGLKVFDNIKRMMAA